MKIILGSLAAIVAALLVSLAVQPARAGLLPGLTPTPPHASCARGEQLAGGRSYRVELASRVDGAAIVFQVFEPRSFDCVKKHPLILEGHGFGGMRQVLPSPLFLSPIAQLTAADYAVISIDQRGHGESGGTVRVMDPDFEGRDLIQIVDWAEENLDYLAYRDNNLLLGAVGGSYGGGYQLLLNAIDPKGRLDAIVPQITWHDLTYSLNPGNTVKSSWGLALAGLGDVATGGSLDPFIRQTLVEAAVSNRFPSVALDFLSYHSPSYFCGNPRKIVVGANGDTSGYRLDPILGGLPVTAGGKYVVQTPATPPHKVDALFFQGIRDTLFNFNEAYANYQCLQRAGGDVRLLTYPVGHHYLMPSIGLLFEGAQGVPAIFRSFDELAQGDTAILTGCGKIDVTRATLAWFDEKLKGKGRADDVITSGKKVCLSTSYGDAVNVTSVTVGGRQFSLSGLLGLPVLAASGAAGAVPTIVPLTTIRQSALIAGIPTATLNVSYGNTLFDSLCQTSTEPLLNTGTCDSILFVGVGRIRPTLPVPELLEDQVTPIRGFGTHQIRLAGIAERLRSGDQLVLLIYGQNPVFAASFSRDLLSSVVAVKGSVKLPLLKPDGSGPLP